MPDEAFPQYFAVKGKPMCFDLKLLPQGEVFQLLEDAIPKHGGRIVQPGQRDFVWRFVLYDQSRCDGSALKLAAASSDCICVRWEWVVKCLDEKKFIGPLDDYGGYKLSLNQWDFDNLNSSEASTSVSPLRSRTVASSASQRSQTIVADTPDFIVDPKKQDPEPLKVKARTDGIVPRRSTFHPKSKPPPKRPLPGSDREGSEESSRSKRIRSGSTTTSRSAPTPKPKPRFKLNRHNWVPHGPDTPPSPPKKVENDPWFGKKYTKEDIEYLKNYAIWYCNRHYDPDFTIMFKEISTAAKHHTYGGWKRQYEHYEKDFVNESEDIRRVYLDSEDEDDTEARPKSRDIAAILLPSIYKDPLDNTYFTEQERKALVRFMAEAPEGGVELPELLQNFTLKHPGHSWRAWQKFLRQHETNFQQAVAAERTKLQAH